MDDALGLVVGLPWWPGGALASASYQVLVCLTRILYFCVYY